MTNAAFRIRIPPSGPDMPAGTPGYVLTVQSNGLDVAPEPAPGGGGSVTPLTAALVGDRNGAATTPTGAYSGDKAFNGATALTAAVAALAATNGGGIELAPGTYPCPPLVIAEQTLAIRGLGPPSGVTGSAVVLTGNIELNASDAQCALTLEDLTSGAGISDSGTGADVTVNRASSAAINITGSLTATQATIDGPSLANATDCERTAFTSDFVAVGASKFLQCTFAGTFDCQGTQIAGCKFNNGAHVEAVSRLSDSVIQSGQFRVDDAAVLENLAVLDGNATHLLLAPVSTTSEVNGCQFGGGVQFGEGAFNVRGTSFAHAIAQTSNGILRMWDCTFDTTAGLFSIASAHLFMNAATELAALLAGLDVEVTIHALDSSQGGDAVFISDNDTTVDCTAETRAYLGQQVLGANHTYTLNTTGNVGDTQTYTIDSYNRTAHTLTIKDDAAATIATLGTVAAGEGLRYTFGISQTTHKFVLVSIAKITK